MQSTSLRRVKLIVDELRKLELKTYSGENVSLFTCKALDHCIDLELCNSLPDDHLLILVESLSRCSVEYFRLHWIAKWGAVEQYTKSILGKDSDVIQALANSLPEKFDFRTILESACTMYRDLVDSNLWDPINQKDKGKAPAAFITKAEFNTAVQKQFP